MRPIDGDSAVQQIREFAECKKGCSENFYYGRGCNACAFGKIIKIVENAPTIDPYGTWIPCSERLPVLDDSDGGVKQSDICLCAIKWNDGEITEETGWYNSSGLWNYDSTDCKVIAWMPLPERWKGDEL